MEMTFEEKREIEMDQCEMSELDLIAKADSVWLYTDEYQSESEEITKTVAESLVKVYGFSVGVRVEFEDGPQLCAYLWK